jgi:hypothetical protein
MRMPAVFTALDTGRICRSKAWVFADLCADLTAEQVDVVCVRLLPEAGQLTTGELAARIKKLAIALYPEWAARRYATAVRERNVIGYLSQDGTATVTGSALPVEQAAVACAHVEDLARAAKRAGHPGQIRPLRADIYLGLLDGRRQYLNRAEIIADLLTHTTHEDREDTPAASAATAGTSAAGPRRRPASSCGWDCPPCSPGIAIPARSPAGVRSPRRSPAPSRSPSAAPNGAMPSPT